MESVLTYDFDRQSATPDRQPCAARALRATKVYGSGAATVVALDDVTVGFPDARAEMSATMPPEYVEAFFRFYADGDLDESKVLATVRDLTGRRPRRFEQWAIAHADRFRAAAPAHTFPQWKEQR